MVNLCILMHSFLQHRFTISVTFLSYIYTHLLFSSLSLSFHKKESPCINLPATHSLDLTPCDLTDFYISLHSALPQTKLSHPLIIFWTWFTAFSSQCWPQSLLEGFLWPLAILACAISSWIQPLGLSYLRKYSHLVIPALSGNTWTSMKLKENQKDNWYNE